MKMFTTIATAVALVASAPAVAAAGAPVPASETTLGAKGESRQFEDLGVAAYIAGAVLLGLVIWGLIELIDDDGDTVSP